MTIVFNVVHEFLKKRISKFALFQPKHFPLLLKSLSTGPTLYYFKVKYNYYYLNIEIVYYY